MKLGIMLILFLPMSLRAGSCLSKKKIAVEPSLDREFVKSLKIHVPLDTARSKKIEEEIVHQNSPHEQNTPTTSKAHAHKQYVIVISARMTQQILNAK